MARAALAARAWTMAATRSLARSVRCTRPLVRPDIKLPRWWFGVAGQRVLRDCAPPVERRCFHGGLGRVALAEAEQPSPSAGARYDEDGRLLIAYTCGVCDKRSYKTFSKLAYNKGVVIVRCDGCSSLHLVADNLGWTDSQRARTNIEDIMRERGVDVPVLTGLQALELMARADEEAGASSEQPARSDASAVKREPGATSD